MRQLKTTGYISSEHTSVNTLYNADLLKPDALSASLTYLYGKNDSRIPLLQFTEGQGAIMRKNPSKKDMNDTQYTWPTMGMSKSTTEIYGLENASNTKPGLGHLPFTFIANDNYAHDLYTLYSPDGQRMVRIEYEPEAIGGGKYRITARIISGNPGDYVDPSNFISGKHWGIGPTSIPTQKSDGTTSNSRTPGEFISQYGVQRYSKRIAGNIAAKVVPYQMDLVDGGTTNMWLPFEFSDWEMDSRVQIEEGLWHDTYNRDTNGRITTDDPKTKETVPHGPGVKQILTTFGFHDTYGPYLTLNKVNSIIDMIFANQLTKGPSELVFYGGTGAKRMWHESIMADAKASQYFTPLGESAIRSGKDGYMSYGSYFSQYKTIDNRTLSFVHSDRFDKGIHAEMDKANGRMFNGLPWYSYTMVLLDHTANGDGDRNIQLVCEKDREVITGIYQGMAKLPKYLADGAGKHLTLGTTKDISSYEQIKTIGINIMNPTTGFWFDFEM